MPATIDNTLHGSRAIAALRLALPILAAALTRVIDLYARHDNGGEPLPGTLAPGAAPHVAEVLAAIRAAEDCAGPLPHCPEWLRAVIDGRLRLEPEA